MTEIFVEQTFLVPELAAWLKAVVTFRPRLAHLGRAIMPLVTSAMAGDQPPEECTRLETWDGTDLSLWNLDITLFEPDIAVPATPDTEAGGHTTRLVR
ncbi:hypothetical protein LTR56_027740 [Elasticomyces elasticus]|nr:hypothetical protein LTR56_027740 [Elasticomyces elasticus]